MHAKVLITCGGVNKRTIDRAVYLTVMKQIQPFAGAKKHHLNLSLLWIKNKFTTRNHLGR